MLKNWKWIAVIAMAIAIVILSFTSCPRIPEPTVTIERDTIWDSIVHRDTIPKPVPYYVELPGDTFWPDVDTTVILQKCKIMYQDYFSKKAYNRTVVDDSNLFFSILDTCWKNSLGIGIADWKIRRPQTINTTTTIYGEIPRTKWWLGLGLGGEIKSSLDSTIRIPLSLLITSKKNWGLEFSTDIRSIFRQRYYVEAKGFLLLNQKKK